MQKMDDLKEKWKRRRLVGMGAFLASLSAMCLAIQLGDPYASILALVAIVPLIWSYCYMRWCPACSKLIAKPGRQSACPYCGLQLK
jgi:hypothetical protein